MIELIASYGGWSWLVAGLVLLGIELLVPGGVFLWFGISALIVGAGTLVQDFNWQVQWLAFALFSVLSVFLWRKYKTPHQSETDSPHLNRRAHRYLNREFVLETAIENGAGEVRVDDTVWRVRGPDCAVGSVVRIMDTDGPVLLVEPT